MLRTLLIAAPVAGLIACTHPDRGDEVLFEITSPADGEVVDGPVSLDLLTDGLSLEEAISRRPVPPPLPLRLLVPTADAHIFSPHDDMPRGYVQVWLDGQAVQAAAAEHFELGELETGRHTVLVELHWPFGRRYSPPVMDVVSFNVP